MNKMLCGLLLSAALVTSVAGADVLELNPGHPERYTVVKGDTLWDISARFLKDPWRWPDIWKANPQVKNPHLIYPGDVLVLVIVNGVPELRLEREGEARNTIRLSPQVRSSEIVRAIPTIPLDVIQPFLTRPRVVTSEEMQAAPYIVQSADEHLIAATGNRVYVRGIQGEAQERYSVLRLGQAYHDPDASAEAKKKKQDVLGYEAIYVADAVLLQGGDPATFALDGSRQEARNGDRLLPASIQEQEASFQPRPPGGDVRGRIISVIEGVSQVGQYQVVVLNLGAQQGMEAGHVLAAYQAGHEVRDLVSPDPKDTVKLPDEHAALLMVFRPFERVSYALVMKATRPLRVGDKVRTPS
ncbi:MAG: LysM peptidoglycan-binding domain-containing protein [Gammaproteobacteria bacterium]|nr:LysM peptidoglycan-binding domain-containing protein [Gammaproteobacteria bacterium]